jgi:hypothetical protein
VPNRNRRRPLRIARSESTEIRRGDLVVVVVPFKSELDDGSVLAEGEFYTVLHTEQNGRYVYLDSEWPRTRYLGTRFIRIPETTAPALLAPARDSLRALLSTSQR